ncbi:hypothetical protein M885DRAFT_533227 [Pelagophyceae sp. CCMP2097]|nr:hypothetical protein M885DRAFT_533227 [Pelagophyceae sp. CCMP2097]
MRLASWEEAVAWLICNACGPLSLAYCTLRWGHYALSSTTRNPLQFASWANLSLQTWLHAEAVWWVCMECAVRVFLDARPKAWDMTGQRWNAVRDSVKKLFVEDLLAGAGGTWVSGWLGADYAQLKKRDLLDWWAWATCCAPSFDSLRSAERAIVEDDVAMVEDRLGKLLCEGEASLESLSNAQEKTQAAGLPRNLAIKLNLDSVGARSAMKPLWMYALVRGVGGLFVRWLMQKRGFSRVRIGRVRFWVWRNPMHPVKRKEGKSGKSGLKARCPVLFLHGVGVGLAPYAALLHDLLLDAVATHRSAVIVLDMPHVSMTSPLGLALRGGVPDASAHVAAIARAIADCYDDGDDRVPEPAAGVSDAPPELRRRNANSEGKGEQDGDGARPAIRGADVFAHSYGTIVAAWLIKSAPDLVQSATLAEPVSLLIHHARVARSFLYSGVAGVEQPLKTLAEMVHTRLLKMDPVIVHVLMRNFWWFENTLFVDDLGSAAHRTTVLLSECDDYTPSQLIRDRLTPALSDKLRLVRDRGDGKARSWRARGS